MSVISKKVVGRENGRPYIRVEQIRDGYHEIWNLPTNGNRAAAILVFRGKTQKSKEE